MRGRTRPKGPNPLTRSYESNGPDVKVRGTAQHIADKYAQLARDAQSSGDHVSAENYHQHAEHYYRMIAAAQEQLRQQYGTTFPRPFDEDGEEGDEEGGPNGMGYPGQADDMGDGAFPQQPYVNGDRNGQRFDRGDRQDRGGQDRGDRQDRGQDRGQRFNNNDRYDRQDRTARGDRPERNGQDRGGQDRAGQDRGGQDRGAPDRNGQERNGQDRGQDRGYDRANGSDRYAQDRGERQDRGDRPERNGQDRNGQDRGERQDRYTQERGPQDGAERGERVERQADRPPQAERPQADRPQGERSERRERYPRGERRERAPRGDQPHADDEIVQAELPAFLTNPAPRPSAVAEEFQEREQDAVAAAGAEVPDLPVEAEARPKRRPRTRRPVEPVADVEKAAE